MKREKDLMEELNEIIQNIHFNLTGGTENLRVIYEPSCPGQELEKTVSENRERDMRMKITSAGPHRDDLCMEVNGIDIRRYGSQGQQRTAALSLKLSEIYIVKRTIKDTPVLLLDDVLSELDSSRQTYLLDSIHDIQTMITCTGLDDFISHRFHINKIFQVVTEVFVNEVFDKVIGLCYTGNNYGKLVKTLDKEEFRIKLEEINKLVQNKDYKGAMNIVDSIDWRRVKNVRTLCVVGEIYAANGRYEDSKEIFLLAYHKASIGKNILYRLVEISLRMKNVDEATEFYEEYKQVAPNDSSQYILQYKIARVKNISLDEQIKILEEYKEHEFTEKWSYELAALYYKAGEKEKSLELCNEIILWFSEGKYVMKAYDLKQRMGELTGEEKAKYEKQFVPKLIKPEEAGNIKKAEQDRPEDSEEEKDLEKETSEKFTEEEEQPEIIRIEKNSRENDGAESIQDKISKGIRDIFGGARKKADEELNEEKESSEEVTETEEDQIPEEIIKTDSTEKEA